MIFRSTIRAFKRLRRFLKHATWKDYLRAVWNAIRRIRFRTVSQASLVIMIAICGIVGDLAPGIFNTSELVYTIDVYTGEQVQVKYITNESQFYEYPETKQTKTSQNKGPKFLYSKATKGDVGYTHAQYEITYDFMGHILTRNQVSELETKEAEDIEYRPGSKVKVGAYYYVSYSRFGVDCAGCSGEKTGVGNFASGIHYDKRYGVRQYDGSYKEGITYEGYYIVAADRSIPLCTVMRIENHRFTGAGIHNNEPFEVVVLDRGGAIQGNRLDFFIGLQSDMQVTYTKRLTKKRMKATILKFGKWTRNSKGQYACKL